VTRPRFTNKIVLFFVVAAIALLATYLFWSFAADVEALLARRMGDSPSPSPQTIVNVVKLVLVGIVGYLFVRALNSLFFALAFWLKRIDAPTLIRNIFTIVAFTILFLIAFTLLFPEVNLGALFTTSAIFGVILGLALQDTLGNFFAGISLQADRPFQVGDVITVGAQRHTGVVEEISWRAIKIRTFTNHVVLIANSNAAKEPIEVFPRGNLNARIVLFNTLYTDSPAKTIQVVREAVREADNVSEKIPPIVRIKALGDNGVDFEVKYWPEDYAKYNDTDALVRQRIWYAFRRAGLNFAYPTRTLHVERRASAAMLDGDSGAIAERLSAVAIFSPLSADEITMLAQAAVSHVFAPGETVIRAGDPGSSMFVVHQGKVRVQVSENGRPRTVANLNEGDFFGEMALFTGEPRTANVLAVEETEVLEIGHAAMKRVFDTNPDLVEALSFIMAERREGLASHSDPSATTRNSAGILSAIKRFFGLSQ
jgi:small-conductance mechanosensitive channel/CRP-like cAMP-binding protein